MADLAETVQAMSSYAGAVVPLVAVNTIVLPDLDDMTAAWEGDPVFPADSRSGMRLQLVEEISADADQIAALLEDGAIAVEQLADEAPPEGELGDPATTEEIGHVTAVTQFAYDVLASLPADGDTSIRSVSVGFRPFTGGGIRLNDGTQGPLVVLATQSVGAKPADRVSKHIADMIDIAANQLVALRNGVAWSALSAFVGPIAKEAVFGLIGKAVDAGGLVGRFSAFVKGLYQRAAEAVRAGVRWLTDKAMGIKWLTPERFDKIKDWVVDWAVTQAKAGKTSVEANLLSRLFDVGEVHAKGTETLTQANLSQLDAADAGARGLNERLARQLLPLQATAWATSFAGAAVWTSPAAPYALAAIVVIVAGSAWATSDLLDSERPFGGRLQIQPGLLSMYDEVVANA